MSAPPHLQSAAEDSEQVKLLVDFVVLTSSDERRSEVLLTGLSNGRQAGCLQVVVETLHLIRRLLCKETEVSYLKEYSTDLSFHSFNMSDSQWNV